MQRESANSGHGLRSVQQRDAFFGFELQRFNVGALERLCAQGDAVIATGGGAVVDPDNRTAMRACGSIVCLTADPAAILARIGSGRDRPLLAAAEDRPRRVRQLLDERAAAYADADLTVETSRTSAEEVSAVIAEWLLEAGTVDASAKTARK